MTSHQQKAQEFRRREQQILEQALKLFLEHGEERVTVEMIADAASIGKGTVYKHFATKDEIYLRLMISYEEDLAEVFQRMDSGENKDRAKLAKEYFSFRMRDPDKYALFERLEHDLTQKPSCESMLEELYRIRSANLDKLAAYVQAKIDDDILEPVHPNYHILASWALVHGAVALYHSKYYRQLIDDSDEFFSFLGDLGIRMGNKRRDKTDEPDDS